MEQVIGEAAGEVWRYLVEKGRSSVRRIAANTKLNQQEVNRAIGWLAREGKLVTDQNGKTDQFDVPA